MSDLRYDNPLCEAWLKATGEFGLPQNADINAETMFGIGRYQLTLKGRWRDRAIGVRYICNGQQATVRASREVTLAPGSIQTPQLLQLSGIGSAAPLHKQPIKVRVYGTRPGKSLK